MCVTICGRFCPDEGVVAGYDNRIRVKYTAKWGVQIAGMIFQTGSRACRSREHFFARLTNSKKDVRKYLLPQTWDRDFSLTSHLLYLL